jgi:hypothetical protein
MLGGRYVQATPYVKPQGRLALCGFRDIDIALECRIFDSWLEPAKPVGDRWVAAVEAV